MPIFISIALTAYFLMGSFAQGAEPVTKQPRKPSISQQHNNIQQLKITPEYLYQQISLLKNQVKHLQVQNQQIFPLKKQVNSLQNQVNILKSVVQITQQGTTIQTTNLTINASKDLSLTSSKDFVLMAGSKLKVESGENPFLKRRAGCHCRECCKNKAESPANPTKRRHETIRHRRKSCQWWKSYQRKH